LRQVIHFAGVRRFGKAQPLSRSAPMAAMRQETPEADLCAEVSGIASDFQLRFGAGTEQEIIDDLFGRARDSGECVRVLKQLSDKRI
jgi:hypothetical protein